MRDYKLNMDQSEQSERTHDSKSNQHTSHKILKWNPRKIINLVLLILLFILVLGICVTASAVIYLLKPTLPMPDYIISKGENITNEGNSTIVCAQNFYPKAYNGVHTECKLLCEAWINPGDIYSNFEKVFTITSALFCLFTCVVLAIIAFSVQNNEMLTFPKLYLVCASLSTALTAFFILVGYMDKQGLFCHSDDFIDTLKHGTPFCTLSGITFTYGLLQIFIWMMYHALGVCWIITLPLHYRSNVKMIKRIHIVTITLALILPAIPCVAQLAVGGYRPYYSPPRFCSGINFHLTYWTFLLPAAIIFAVTIFDMVLALGVILKNLLTSCKQCVVKNTKKQVIEYGKAEVKILCIVCYYVSLGTFVLLALTYFESTHDVQLVTIMDYLECHLPGFYPSELESNECGDSEIPYVRLGPFYALSAIGILQLTLIPVVILVFTVRCTCKFHCCRRQTESAQAVVPSSRN